MDLREIKKESHALDSVKDNLKKFQESWIKPIRNNTNRNLQFLNNLPEETKKDINNLFPQIRKNLKEIEHGQIINQKLTHTARYLIELKLTTLNNDKNKRKVMTNRLLYDDFLKFKNTITDIEHFETNLRELSKHYNRINRILQKRLELENSVILTDLPHRKHLNNIYKISRKQKELAKHMGRHLISLLGEK